MGCWPALLGLCVFLGSSISMGVFGYYLGGMVTEGRFWVGESRDLGDRLWLGGKKGVLAATIGLFS